MRGRDEEEVERVGTANETDKRGNHGTDNVLRYATLLREIVTQFDSGKNEQLALAHGRTFDSNRYTRANFFEDRHNGKKGGELLRYQLLQQSACRPTVAQLHCT
ncbi:hypothetical protein DMN91_010403 [Ooceraea biroi]|uniref:Uncharacterized protein n=1 Tax=Ooceraea biroi TaxID=2015173 RepID=A0A3L8DCB6_OOCBI|nr:hypothetical protein DMN91_010403 [Ooceraea biroi]